jgi:hypothetical protein
MSAQEELRELVERLGDELASDALVYVRQLLEAQGSAAGSNGKGHRRAMPPTVPGEQFFAPQDGATPVTRQSKGQAVDFDELLGDFWPEDETADEFIAGVRQWRREGGNA